MNSDWKFRTDRKATRVVMRGLEFVYSRPESRLNLCGFRKGVARCIVAGCMCSGRDNWLLRQGGIFLGGTE